MPNSLANLSFESQVTLSTCFSKLNALKEPAKTQATSLITAVIAGLDRLQRSTSYQAVLDFFSCTEESSHELRLLALEEEMTTLGDLRLSDALGPFSLDRPLGRVLDMLKIHSVVAALYGPAAPHAQSGQVQVMLDLYLEHRALVAKDAVDCAPITDLTLLGAALERGSASEREQDLIMVFHLLLEQAEVSRLSRKQRGQFEALLAEHWYLSDLRRQHVPLASTPLGLCHELSEALKHGLPTWLLFFALAWSVGYSFTRFYQHYVKTLALHQFRYGFGYQLGRYKTTWGGRPDTVHAAELVAELPIDRYLPTNLIRGLTERHLQGCCP